MISATVEMSEEKDYSILAKYMEDGAKACQRMHDWQLIELFVGTENYRRIRRGELHPSEFGFTYPSYD